MSPELLAQVTALIDAARAASDTTPKPTIGELYQQWVPTAKGRPDWPTCKTTMKMFLTTEIVLADKAIPMSDLPWPECGLHAIDAWRTKATAMLAQGTRRPISAAYRNRCLNTLQSMLAWHVDHKTIPFSPVSGCGREDESESEREGWFTPAQFAEFFRYADPVLQKMALVSYRCGGLRQSEVRLLRKQDIQWDTRLIVIRSSRHKTRRPKKIPITDDVFSMLEEQATISPSEYLFPNLQGGPWSASKVDDWMVHARSCSFVTLLGETPCFHHLRHSYAMHMLLKGAAPAHVMDAMGITSSKTFGRYVRLAGEALDHFRVKQESTLTLE